MTDDARHERLDDEAAVAELRARLPEFSTDLDEHLKWNGELLIHLVMGDLARFYVREAIDDHELRRRFWMAVDWIATHATDRVYNAIGVSLIEWFAWGSNRERALLVEARPSMSSAVRAIADDFLRSWRTRRARTAAHKLTRARNRLASAAV